MHTHRIPPQTLFVAVLSILLMGSSLWFTSSAHATPVNAIDPSSITITNRSGNNDVPPTVWSGITVSAKWSIPDLSGHAGDTFTLPIPEPLSLETGEFDLTGPGGISYGTCNYTSGLLTCTFSAAVENKRNVHGTLWLNGEFNRTIAAETITFTVDKTVTDVDIPGTGGVIWSPRKPEDTGKHGWFSRTDHASITWRIVVPGSDLVNKDKLVIDDTYAMQGTRLTLAPGNYYPRLYSVPDTVDAWNQQLDQQVLYGSGTQAPGVQVVTDDVNDTIHVEAPGPFDPDRIYVFIYRLVTDGPIPIGARFVNRATINGTSYTSEMTRKIDAGGTAAGDTVGHIAIHKELNGQVPADTRFPVTLTYEVNGQTMTKVINLSADGTAVELSNILNGTVVTVTENVPAVPGVSFGDPVFSGTNVVDGGPDSPSATVTVQGETTVGVTLTNQATPTPPTSTPTPTPPPHPRVVKPQTLPATGDGSLATGAAIALGLAAVAAATQRVARRK